MASILVLASCQSKRFERAAVGQPTMHELAQRKNAESLERQKQSNAIRERAKSLTEEQAKALYSELKAKPNNPDLQAMLVQHYQMTGDVTSLTALKLWYIEHQPDGQMWIGNIDSHLDRKGYERGRALWLANVKRPGATPIAFERAAYFLESGDRSHAESVLRAGMKAYPSDPRWTRELGTHYAQALAGSGEPFTEFSVIRVANAGEASSPYAQFVRARLAESKDAKLLIATAQGLSRFGNLQTAPASFALAREYVERAERLDPDIVNRTRLRQLLTDQQWHQRLQQIVRLSPAEKAKLGESDQLLLAWIAMQSAWATQQIDEAGKQARKAMDLAARLSSDPIHDAVIFQSNMTLGKLAFRQGDPDNAVRYLLAAAVAPGPGVLQSASYELNLPRVLIDAGRRSSVAEYLERVAPKTNEPARFEKWAAQVRQGINPVDMPFSTSMGCGNDPC